MSTNPFKRLFIFDELVDNSFLILFRILFGSIIGCYIFGLTVSGWVKETFVEPVYIFPSIGFDFLNEVMKGSHMYGFFIVLSLLFFLFALGLGGRVTKVLMALGWTLVFLSQKAHYNNHYYLMALMAWLLVFMPTHQRFSLDNYLLKRPDQGSCLSWNRNIFILLLWILYSYAAFNKIYPGWVGGEPFKAWFAGHYDSVLGGLYKSHYFHVSIAYLGILFDALIIPVLIFAPTRIFGILGMFLFHCFNGLTFHIGVFPFLSLSTLIFFIDPAKLNSRLPGQSIHKSSDHFVLRPLIILFLVIQFFLPLRHFFIEGNVFYTEEGQKLAWRMMLRHKTGHLRMWVKDLDSGVVNKINLRKYLSSRQLKKVGMLPEVSWQLAQFLKRDLYKDKNVSIHAQLSVLLNGRHPYVGIKKHHDLLKYNYSHFSHNAFLETENFNGIFRLYN